ncbi:hypothetical protein ACFWP0_29525 [Achromobacter sp. NPDC058515]|uniref:hypothetical protein n=1 Tax=Achromobacter sp. NPDC058515 TaxID=3346533 RepID=UPI0036599841
MKEDAIQLELLEERVDLAQLPFDRAVVLFSEFLRLVARELCSQEKIERCFFEWVDDSLHLPDLFFSGECSSVDFRSRRIEVWRKHDMEEDFMKKRFLRAIVCCLYEETSEEGQRYETSEMVELFFSVLLDMDPGLCLRFRLFLEHGTDIR